MKHRRYKHSLSHRVDFSCDQGEIIPCSLVEVLPGDIFRHGTSILIRLAPMLAPVFTTLNVSVLQFYVPLRTVWSSFEDFITGGEDGMNASVYPTITHAGAVAVGSLSDYLGVPPGFAGLEVSALPYRCYAKIWNEWYRDQDLQAELPISLGDGPDSTTNIALQMVNWEKDYFTSARPWEQKGPQITIPIGTQAPVKGLYVGTGINTNAVSGTAVGGTATGTNSISGGSPTLTGVASKSAAGTTSATAFNTANANVYADLSVATGIPVSELRLALSLQRFEEESARYGSRYVEYLMSRFGVRSSDARLQRSELLSRSKQVVQISEVLATADSGTADVGDLKGHGIGSMRSNRYTRMFEEHGYILTLLHVQPKTMYSQGLARHWNRRDKYDFFQVETQFIGQQEILKKEIYAGAASPDGTFGWQDRNDEYRRVESRIAGEFRTTTLDFWHQGRIFSSEPSLNSAFVTSNPTERIFAVPSQDVLYITARHSIQAKRVVAPNSAAPHIR